MDQQPTPTSAPEPPTPKNRKKTRIIIGVVALVLLIAIVALVAGIVKNMSQKSNTADLKPGTITGPYVEREHYPRKDIGTAIADATALDFKSSDNVVKTTKGMVIYSACTVVTLADLRKQNIWPIASPTPGVTTMSYIDGAGSGTINFSHGILPSGEDGNECSYSLQDKGTVYVDLYQPHLVSNDSINDEIARSYEKAPDIKGVSGVELFRQKPSTGITRDLDKDTTTYLVRKSPELSFKISVDDKNDRQAKVESLIKVALANLNKLATDPQGAPRPTYANSPTFKQTYLRACSFMDDEGMKAYSGDPAAASVTEKVSNSTGVVQFKELKDDTRYVYVENQCHRISASPGGSPLAAKASMDLNTTSYTSSQGAKNAMISNKDYYKNAVSVPNIGDEAIVLKNNEGENALIVRKDRFIVTFNPDMTRQASKGLDDQTTFMGAIKPYADYVVAGIMTL